jgi:hypothetical protein
MYIDSETYSVDPKNYYKSVCVKKQIVLCGSLRKDHNHIVHLKHKAIGNSKRWNAYTISREGIVYQHYNPKYYGDFLGVKEIDKQAISVVLENMGGLFKISSNEYINWINEICETDNIHKKMWSDYLYWEKYTDKQVEAAGELCKKLCKDFNIPIKIIEFNLYHKDTKKYNGIVSRSNYFDGVTDLNPSFDVLDFQTKINDEKVKTND